jgi:antitoxin component YwqK of YwqJK toxin-antitoxin module
MKTLLMAFLLVLVNQVILAQGYYYYGNSNLVGTGKMEGDKKEGVWKIYARKELADNPKTAIAEVDELEVTKNFYLDVPLYRLEFKNNLLEGIFEEFYRAGSTKKVVNYQNGMLHGDFFEFSESGELLLSGNYVEGQKSGDWTVFRSDGNVKSEYSYENNLLVGTSTSYYANGQIAERIPFERGTISGVYESFFPDGSPKERVVFVAGQEQGEFKQFHADGKLAIAAIFSKGVLEGPWESYDAQGLLVTKGSFVKGERVGEWQERYAAIPEFFQLGFYENDAKTGIWKVLGPDAFVHQEETFKNGMLVSIGEFTTRQGLKLDAGSLAEGDGRRVMYDAEGNRIEKGRYANGLRTGIWYSYFPKTNLVSYSGPYVNGKKRGTWKQYDFSGTLVSEQVYAADESGDPERPSDGMTASSDTRSRFYHPKEPQGGMVNPRVLVLTPDGVMGVSGPGMFQLGN